jgi:hypothetical protein
MFSERSLWRILPPGILLRVLGTVSKEYLCSIFRFEECAKKHISLKLSSVPASRWFLTGSIFRPWSWRQVTRKHRYIPDDSILQKCKSCTKSTASLWLLSSVYMVLFLSTLPGIYVGKNIPVITEKQLISIVGQVCTEWYNELCGKRGVRKIEMHFPM